MLKPTCTWFLRRARAGVESGHRQRCASCNAYISAIEGIGRLNLSLPADLDQRLRPIPRVIPSCPPPRAATLPADLRHRLSAILPQAEPALPRFAGSPLYTVAASYLAVLAVATFWGNPYQIVQPTFSSFRGSASRALAQTGDTVSAWIREARSELELRSNHAGELRNEFLQRLENTLTLPTTPPTRKGQATRNGDPDDNS